VPARRARARTRSLLGAEVDRADGVVLVHEFLARVIADADEPHAGHAVRLPAHAGVGQREIGRVIVNRLRRRGIADTQVPLGAELAPGRGLTVDDRVHHLAVGDLHALGPGDGLAGRVALRRALRRGAHQAVPRPDLELHPAGRERRLVAVVQV